MKEFSDTDFNDAIITCSNCHWKGTGAEAVIIDFFGVTSAWEVHCPKCDEKLGVLNKKDMDTGPSGGDELSNQIG